MVAARYGRGMPEPTGADLDAIRARREQLRDKYLADERPASTARGIHHAAFVCSDVEETINFYQGLLGFPLVELVENRDYAGSSHFFFDLGNRTLLGFFDFPGLGNPPYIETIGALQHMAISVSPESFELLKKRLEDAGIDYLGPDRGANDSMYFRDPNGMGIELYREVLGHFEGSVLLPD